MVPAGHCSTSSSLAWVRSRGQLRPFLESDEGARVDDAVGRQAALADVQFTTARGGGRARANHARIRLAG